MWDKIDEIINGTVKNNPNKFLDRFSFKLSNEELAIYSRSKISTLNKKIRFRNYGIMCFDAIVLELKIVVGISMIIIDTLWKY